MMNITLNHVRAALALNPFDVEAARKPMWPRPLEPRAAHIFRPPDPSNPARLAGVLTLLYPNNGTLNIVLMKRTDIPGDRHSGQISFPGGRHENSETLTQTALREANEELGVIPDTVELLGKLACIHTRSRGFEIHPTVGYTPARPVWRPHPAEVARVLEMPLPALLDDSLKTEEEWERDGYKMIVPFYRWDGEPVWGATGMMLSELERRIRAVLGQE